MTMQTSQSERETTSGDCVHIVRTKPLYVHNVYMQKTNSNSNDDDQNRYTSFYIPNACDRPRCPFLHLYPFFLCFSLSFSISKSIPFHLHRTSLSHCISFTRSTSPYSPVSNFYTLARTHTHSRTLPTFLAVSFRRIILCIFFIWWCVRSLFSSAL